jgi:hypothetical protein
MNLLEDEIEETLAKRVAVSARRIALKMPNSPPGRQVELWQDEAKTYHFLVFGV